MILARVVHAIRMRRAAMSRRASLRAWAALPDIDALARLLDTGWFTEQVRPTVRASCAARRILAVSPHPDDETIAAGGTLLRARANGADVHIVFLTSGERARADDARHGAAEREAEAARVASAIGATAEYWRLPTHHIPIDDATAARLRAVIDAYDPDLILLPFFTDSHEDHRAAALLGAHALRTPRCRAAVWAYAVYATIPANVVVDITDIAGAKAALIRRWESECAHRDWAHYAAGRDAVHARWIPGAAPRYGEAFFVVPAAEYAAIGATFRNQAGAQRPMV